MSLDAYSLFFYGFEVSVEQMHFDFNEGGIELTALLEAGTYTLTEFVSEMERAFNVAGARAYTVSVNRATQRITISADGIFQLKVATGTHTGSSLFHLAGFVGANLSGAASYTGNIGCGYKYAPQFMLQSYVSSEDSVSMSYAVLNKSASGKVEMITFGEEKVFEFNIKYATDTYTGAHTPIRPNGNGVADLRQFMSFLISKGSLEFMPDENDPDTYFKVLLESTPDDSKGLKYKLKEMYDRGLPGFFETGVIKLRRMD